MRINPNLISKSIASGKHSSGMFNEQHKVIFGNDFVVSGFSLIDIDEQTPSAGAEPGIGLTLTIGPGIFCSNGVFVKVLEETSLFVETSPSSAKLIVGHTANNQEQSEVVIELIEPSDVGAGMAVIGYYTPSFKFAEAVDTNVYGGVKTPFYKPATHSAIDEIASDVSSGVRVETIPGSTLQTNVVSGVGYRAEVKNVTLASNDPSLLVFYMGTLLEEGTHYEIESPGSLVIYKTPVVLSYTDITGQTFETSYTTAFLDIIQSKDFIFRQKYVYSHAPENEDITVEVLDNFKNELTEGKFEPLVFVNRTSNVSGGTFLNPDRFSVISKDSEEGVRDAINIQPRVNWSSNNGLVSDEYTGSDIETITVIGVRGLSANNLLARPADSPGTIPGSSDYESLVPIIDNHSLYSGIPYKFIETPTAFKADSGEAHVFVDGKLCPADHYYANSLNSTASSTPDFDGLIEYQIYASDKNSSAFELGTVPIRHSKEFATSHGSTSFRSVSSINLRPTYLSPKTTEFLEGSKTFANLEEAAQTPGISEALFNLTSTRHFDATASTFEFSNMAGAAFNGNYFVTYHSLAGFDDDAIDPSLSILNTLTMSVTMFSDVPLGVGLSLQQSHKLNYYSDATTPSNSGLLALDQDPLDSVGASLKDPATGLYTVDPDPNQYFSGNNPIVTYASLDAYLQPWMDSFGFTTDATAPRTYLRNAGVTYDSSGSISTSFSDLMQNKEAVGGGGKSLVSILDTMASRLSSNSIPIGTAQGYAYGGTIINLTQGSIVASPNRTTSLRYPIVPEFQHGIYFGNLGFELPYEKGQDPKAEVIQDFVSTNPTFYDNGIFSIPGTNEQNVGYKALTINNVCCMLNPIPGGGRGFKDPNQIEVCRHRFVWLWGGTIIENPNSLAGLELGIEIIAFTRDDENALVNWSVFGPLDPNLAIHNHTDPNLGSGVVGSESEHYYRIDDNPIE